jgi:hypothetical protein
MGLSLMEQFGLRNVCILGFCLALIGMAAGQDKAPHPGQPPSKQVCQTAPDPDRVIPSSCPDVDNILPDADTALTVGMAIMETRYGTAALERGKPYKAASFTKDQWCVFHKSDPWIRGGGHPEICLSRKDGRTLSIGRSL